MPKLRFGSEIRGTLMVEHDAGKWRAEIAGRSIEAHRAGDTVRFELPDGRGAFSGRLAAGREHISGMGGRFSRSTLTATTATRRMIPARPPRA